MKLFIFVTLLLGQSIHAETTPWPKAIVQSHSKKTLKQICEKTSQRIQKKVCSGVKKEDLKNTSKVSTTLEDAKTVVVKYNGGQIKIRKTDEVGTLLINRKALYLEEVTSQKDLKSKIEKLAGAENLTALIPTLAFLFQAYEHDTCSLAEKVVKSCLNVKEIIALNKMKKTSDEADALNAQMNYLSPGKKETFESCSCKNKICGFTEDKKLAIKKDFDSCQKQVKEFAKKAKQEKWNDEVFAQFKEQITKLPIKEKPRQPALFKEDSYKE